MYTKTIIMTKTSCKGKEFTCIREVTVMDEFDKEELRRKRREELRVERELRELYDLQRYADHNRTSMSKIMEAYDEYMESERYY